MQNIVYRTFCCKLDEDQFDITNKAGLERICGWVSGGKDINREEKERLFIDLDLAYKKVVDYNHLNFFLNIFTLWFRLDG